MDDLPTRLRAANEDTVIDAVEGLPCDLDAKPVELLEFFNAMLDRLGIPDADGDTYERLQ